MHKFLDDVNSKYKFALSHPYVSNYIENENIMLNWLLDDVNSIEELSDDDKKYVVEFSSCSPSYFNYESPILFKTNYFTNINNYLSVVLFCDKYYTNNDMLDKYINALQKCLNIIITNDETQFYALIS